MLYVTLRQLLCWIIIFFFLRYLIQLLYILLFMSIWLLFCIIYLLKFLLLCLYITYFLSFLLSLLLCLRLCLNCKLEFLFISLTIDCYWLLLWQQLKIILWIIYSWICKVFKNLVTLLIDRFLNIDEWFNLIIWEDWWILLLL